MSLPNIVLFVTDDHGPWAIGSYGNPDVRTPTLDFLAQRGVRFVHAFASAPICSSARASLLTGTMPSQHGIHDWLREDEPAVGGRDWLADQRTLQQQLTNLGYRCMYVGKWHLGRSSSPAPGFAEWFSVPQPQGGHSGHQWYSDHGTLVERNDYKTTVLTDAAVGFLRACGPDEPFLLVVSYIATHASDHQPERLVASYRQASITPTWDAADPYRGAVAPRERLNQYYAAVTHIDEGVGRILDVLDSLGSLDRTAIVYTSDHGTATGQRGVWGKGNGTRPRNMFEYSLAVPLIWSGPESVQGGRVLDVLVDHRHVHSTLLDLAGIPRSPDASPSFRPLLEGIPLVWDDAVYSEYGPVRTIRTATHKLVVRHGHGSDELYDLRRDPWEQTNLLEEPDPPIDITARLSAQLNRFFATHERPETTGLRFDPDSRGVTAEHVRNLP